MKVVCIFTQGTCVMEVETFINGRLGLRVTVWLWPRAWAVEAFDICRPCLWRQRCWRQHICKCGTVWVYYTFWCSTSCHSITNAFVVLYLWCFVTTLHTCMHVYMWMSWLFCTQKWELPGCKPVAVDYKFSAVVFAVTWWHSPGGQTVKCMKNSFTDPGTHSERYQ